jgi:hypothetical protein
MSKRSKSVARVPDAAVPAAVPSAPAVTPAADPPPEASAKANRQMLLWLIIPALVIIIGVIVDRCL